MATSAPIFVAAGDKGAQHCVAGIQARQIHKHVFSALYLLETDCKQVWLSRARRKVSKEPSDYDEGDRFEWGCIEVSGPICHPQNLDCPLGRPSQMVEVSLGQR